GNAAASGIKVAELLLRAGVLDALIVPVDFRALPTQSIRFDIHRRPHLCTAHAVFPTPIPEGKIVLVRRNYDWEQPYGRKLFSALFWPVVFRRGGLKFWYDFMDRFGIPQTIAKLSKAMYEDKRDEVEGQLEKLVRDAVAVMEEGVEISTHEAKGTAASDFFERFQNHIGDTISRVITGATLQRSTGQKGSYAQAREHGQTGNRRGLLDEMMVEAAFNEVAEFIARFSAPNVAPPYMQYDRPQDLHNERATRDARLGGLGARFSLDYFMREYGFREGDIVEISQDAALEFARRTNAHQDEIDDLVAEQLVQGGTVADAQAQRIVRALKSENSPSQIEDILSDIAGEDADAYADLMGEVLMAADMYGRESLRDEVGT
ncbi:MAG: DUF935 family protein, partial [Gemmatimonadota bacterium]|nr:DUF935 family protein [Gemmatimonadota bacterium]